jgi:hypothetical protein
MSKPFHVAEAMRATAGDIVRDAVGSPRARCAIALNAGAGSKSRELNLIGRIVVGDAAPIA